ncbi:hypothetical protein LMH73_009175 [Vibrio splendidus]|nr:hypothetical protein [Vibrio splendidus]MCC4880304.1 hypothetical protein [Vibrio splendidus]
MSISIACVWLMNLIDADFTTQYLQGIGYSMVAIGCFILTPVELHDVKLRESFRKHPCLLPFQLMIFVMMMVASVYGFTMYCLNFTGFELGVTQERSLDELMFTASFIGILVNVAIMLLARAAYSRAYRAL